LDLDLHILITDRDRYDKDLSFIENSTPLESKVPTTVMIGT
jgi:hypothetical protein